MVEDEDNEDEEDYDEINDDPVGNELSGISAELSEISSLLRRSARVGNRRFIVLCTLLILILLALTC